MPLIQWSDTYSVGNITFDAHHQTLVGLINKLHDAMLQGKARQEMSTILTELENYTKYHFAAEEKMLAASGFPTLAQHKVQHREFEAKIAQYQQDLAKGQMGIGTQVAPYLKDWLMKHIQVEDKKYGPYLK